MKPLSERMTLYMDAGFPIIYIETFEEVNADPVVYRWKYKLEEIDPSEEIVVEKLPIKKSS